MSKGSEIKWRRRRCSSDDAFGAHQWYKLEQECSLGPSHSAVKPKDSRSDLSRRHFHGSAAPVEYSLAMSKGHNPARSCQRLLQKHFKQATSIAAARYGRASVPSEHLQPRTVRLSKADHNAAFVMGPLGGLSQSNSTHY